MKVLLIYTNRERSPFPVLPLGLGYIDASLRQQGIQTHLLDLCFARDAVQETRTAVREFAPDVIGLSLRNIDNLTYDAPVKYFPDVRPIVDACHAESSAPVILGGAGFSVFPRPLLKFLNAEAGIVGEGEEIFPAWLKCPPRVLDLPGLVTATDSGTRAITPVRVSNLDALPFPTRQPAHYRRYELAGGVVNVQTKRGCPFRCLYCNYPAIEGHTLRLRSPRNVGEELAQLRKEGVTRIHFVDSVFTYPTEHAVAICEEILKRQLDLHWTCGANPSSLKPDLAILMKRAGCVGVELGIDTAQDSMLHRLRKGFTLDDIARSSAGCRRAGLPFLFHLIFGAPGETPETVNTTLANARIFQPTAVTYSFGLRVYPQTGLVDLLRQNEPVQDDELLEPRFYLASELGPATVDRVLDHARREPGWLAPRQRDSALSQAVVRLGARLGRHDPTWKYARLYDPLKRAVGVTMKMRHKLRPAQSV